MQTESEIEYSLPGGLSKYSDGKCMSITYHVLLLKLLTLLMILIISFTVTVTATATASTRTLIQ